MNDTITIGGVTYNLVPVEPPTPEFPDAAKWKRVERSDRYWMCTSVGTTSLLEDRDDTDGACYKNANYFATEKDAQKQSDRETLARRIQRWRDEHDPVMLDWGNGGQLKYFYYFGHVNKIFLMDEVNTVQIPGVTYFSSEVLANQCVDIFGDEIKRVFYGID